MPRTVTIVITDDLDMTINRYTKQVISMEKGTPNHKDWEDSRSYAVDIVNELFHSNPAIFSHQPQLDKVFADRKEP